MLTQPINAWLTRQHAGIVARRGGQTLLRAEWQRHIVTLGHRLMAEPQRRWALCFDDSYLFSVALLAALHAGKTPVIPGHCREALLQEQRDDFDGVLTDLDFALDCPVVTLPLAENGPLPPLPAIAPDAAVILFTSGSTGRPEQVIKPLHCLDREAGWLARRWSPQLQDATVIASVSHQHLYGLTFRIILPLACGIPFDSRQVLYSEQLAAQDAHQRYVFISSPAFLRRLDRSLRAPACQLIVSAGGTLAWEHAQAAGQWFGQPVDEIYGSTETGVLATRRFVHEGQPWQPFDGVAFSQDARQNWRVRSPLIPQSGGLLLNDKLRFSTDGFRLCGRHDRIVKIEDKRVSLSEIERRLLALPGVVDAAALVITRPERCGVGVVLVLDSDVTARQLLSLRQQWRQALHRWLEPVAMPRYWRVVESIPQNSQSKRAWPQIQELFYAAR
ncbi:AMP-binding protein [Erwinia sp. 9145]|uniref:AMP-binding protein n=1 Tax=Erwinia sp. 9145 TaxID=1500895 RepID=UPI000690FBB1|nr:AMP-binding protein [Erwinia sp. 9145]